MSTKIDWVKKAKRLGYSDVTTMVKAAYMDTASLERAAAILNVSLTTFYKKLRESGHNMRRRGRPASHTSRTE